jgi:NTP pyrophosphatase (non-canonical NTP hydrolase)
VNDNEATVARLQGKVQEFVDRRDWRQFHNAKNLSMAIAIEAAELMEHFQWLRTDELEALKQNPAIMQEVREELADVFCFTLSFANAMDIDLADALDRKMVKSGAKYPVERFKGRYK